MTRQRAVRASAAVLAIVAANGCASPGPRFASWGTMRDVLRDGHAEARVAPSDVTTPTTIVDGRALVATGVPDGALHVRPATATDRAALLIVANVPAWDDVTIADCVDYAELEERIAAALRERGADLTTPTAVRVRGHASAVRMHVIAGACPIANPQGPAPWRFVGPIDDVELVGVFVDGAAGRFTHHDRRSHLHVVAAGQTGHLDDVALHGATLSLPRR